MDWFGFAYALLTGTQVCYPPYGCYSNDPPFDRTLVSLPLDPNTVIGTKFLLHTQSTYNNDPSKPEVLDPLDKQTVVDSHFDGRKKTVMWIHGFIESRDTWYVSDYYEKMLTRDDMNVIFVDWSSGATIPYNQAVGNTRVVGAQVSRMIELLHNTTGLSYKDVHVIGFSLGAHVAGYAGNSIRQKGNLIGRITGLDPASPYFEDHDKDVRLDKTDAAFVDVIHTDTRTVEFLPGYGTDQKSGHLDFYPNGGYHQPGCGSIKLEINFDGRYWSCSHYRSVKLFLESIDSACFTAVPCGSYKRFRKGKCNKHCKKGLCRILGYDARPKRLTGARYFLKTNSDSPYCLN